MPRPCRQFPKLNVGGKDAPNALIVGFVSLSLLSTGLLSGSLFHRGDGKYKTKKTNKKTLIGYTGLTGVGSTKEPNIVDVR